MKIKFIILAFILGFILCDCYTNNSSRGNNGENSINQFNIDRNKIPEGLNFLFIAYPNFISSVDSNSLLWMDGSIMVYDDRIAEKDFNTLLNNADLEDQMFLRYPKGVVIEQPEENFDPGRIRYEPFFLKMYGQSEEEVREKLVIIKWLPSTVNQSIYITSVNDVNKKLQKISDELELLPRDLQKFVNEIGGTFYWRRVSGTNRMSMHSFGIAIDISVKYSNYWRWNNSSKNELLVYQNQIPNEIVQIFEKYGFIWGGKWYHFDTMHFEYRPELLVDG